MTSPQAQGDGIASSLSNDIVKNGVDAHTIAMAHKDAQSDVEKHVEEVLLSEAAIRDRVSKLGAELSVAYAGMRPVLVVVLKGSYIFAADLSRAMSEEHEVEFMRARSYEGTESTGSVTVQGLERATLSGRHVIIVEDIVDTGLTLKAIIKALEGMGAASVKVCTFLKKSTVRRRADTPVVDYVAFDIPDKFIIGYGLDVDQRFRHLPYVAVYKAA